MQRYALLGWPVQHSVSPAMQEAGFRAVGLVASYELIAVAPAGFAACTQRLRNDGYAGWNVTVPHKEQAAAAVDWAEPTARAAASVNTVVNRDGRLEGYSTDGYGLAEALRESFGLPVAGRRFVFVGAGGAARAVAMDFAVRGATALTVVNRTVPRALSVAQAVGLVAPACLVQCLSPTDSAALSAALCESDCLIQATSLGLHPSDPLPMRPDLVPKGLAVVDMVYGNTPFRLAVARRGCPTADGRGMLLHQGVRSFELWTGRPAPVAAMRDALEQALAARGRHAEEGTHA